MISSPLLGPSWLLAALAAVLLPLGAPSLAAQEAPFSRVSIHGGAALNVNRTAFHEHWKAGRGGQITASTPFYLGVAELGADLHRYEAMDPDIPRFDALHVFVGWGLDLSSDATHRWHNGVRVGAYRMAFADHVADVSAGQRNESEVTIGIVSHVDVPLSSNVGLFVAARYLRVYTAPRLDLAYVSAGLRFSFASPSWLRTVLR